ncbi:MAG TPA: metal-dependent hydrolase [Lysobacter sp.]|nr:metal-dependent hydrolase [Lysobacter sp.]
MDSLTHLFVGGAIAAAIAPSSQRRAALLAGAVLNSLPDLDVFPLYSATIRMVWHRGLTDSVFVLPLVGWAPCGPGSSDAGGEWRNRHDAGSGYSNARCSRIRRWTPLPSMARICYGRCPFGR